MPETTTTPHIPTLSVLRERVYKALELHTVNGEPISEALGIKADIAKRFNETLRHALMRIAVRFPLHTKQVFLTTSDPENGIRYATLPADCLRVTQVIGTDGVRKKENAYTVTDGTLTLFGDDESLYVSYQSLPVLPNGDGEDTPLALPPLTFEALVCQTAMLLCPTENTELYARLSSEYSGLYADAASVAASGLDHIRNTVFTRRKRSVCPA